MVESGEDVDVDADADAGSRVGRGSDAADGSDPELIIREEFDALFGGTLYALDGGASPFRAYASYEDAVPSPASYVELEVDGRAVPLIVHNFRYYPEGMERWDVDVVDLLVLNELHELTHWAMTDEERARLDRKARMAGRADGYWLNPNLFGIMDWLSDREGRSIGRPDRPPSLLSRARSWLFD
jgi:hypothetical protein